MISIKELRIGNNVLLDGERISVESISADGKVCVIAQTDLKFVYDKDIDPIPITEELLAELGFEKKGNKGLEQWEKYIGDDFFASVKFNPKTRRCRLEIIDEDMWTNYGNILCWYLHEMENFTYMTIKKELI